MQAALKVIAESYDHICAERLQPSLPIMASHLAAAWRIGTFYETGATIKGQVSISIVRRITARLQQDQPRLPQEKN